jgi:hypothetical protein
MTGMKRLILLFLFLALAPAVRAAGLIGFWNRPQHGGNSSNGTSPSLAYSRALRGYGATCDPISQRLAASKPPA